jgi:hypothetical protein
MRSEGLTARRTIDTPNQGEGVWGLCAVKTVEGQPPLQQLWEFLVIQHTETYDTLSKG